MENFVDNVSTCKVNNYIKNNNSEFFNYEKLIKLVKERTALYNYNHPQHNNRDVIAYLWRQIGTEMKTADVICKAKWANLRSNFVRELRRMRQSGDGTYYMPQWPLFGPLTFLIPYLKFRGSLAQLTEGKQPKVQQTETKQKNSERTNNTCVPEKQCRRPQEKRPRENSDEDDDNDDKMFMLSLVGKMKHLSLVDNMHFRLEVQQLLLKKLCHEQQKERSGSGGEANNDPQFVGHVLVKEEIHEEATEEDEVVKYFSQVDEQQCIEMKCEGYATGFDCSTNFKNMEYS